jgi:choline dehydrogenase-like flavoprotein
VVSRINVDPATGAATGVTVTDRVRKTSDDVRANVVVLCASAIESVRILLNSACARHPGGIGNSSGLLGRGLMDHLFIGLGGPSPRTAAPSGGDADRDPYFAGATGFSIPRSRNVDHPHAAFRGGYSIQGGIGRGPSWYFLAHGEMLPRPDNRISLNPVVRDAWGIPAAHIECTWSSNELAIIKDALRAMRDVADAAGLKVRTPPSGKLLETLAFNAVKRWLTTPSGAFLPGSAIHEMGGAAMGVDRSTSVLNAFCQCWDAPNVFVTDAACFPSGGSQNVALTIMALTVRACGYIVSEYRSGRLSSQ